jgi:PEP-CTERM motif-containing protein
VKARLLASLLGAATLLAPLCAAAASISASYHQLAGDHWLADFVVTGDGSPSLINDFTVFFPDTSFAALVLNTSPANWDSLIIQPDTTLHSPGFLDSLALGSGIATGASLGGFEVAFNYLGNGTPPALHFDVNDANFHPVFSGVTVAAVPEPEVAWLMLLGLGAIAGARVRKQRQARNGSQA